MKKLKHIKFSLLLILSSFGIVAQQTPAPPQSEPILIVGAIAHLGNGSIIENSAIGFDKGKITFVGTQNQVDKNSFSNIINANGKHVYPGFIAANTSSGLIEIDAVRATKDANETGSMLPHIRSLIAYNTESKVTESLRPNGVLIGQITPRGGTISGTSSIVQFDAWNWEDAAIKVDDGIHVNWPSSFTYGKWWLGEDPGAKPDKKYISNVDKIKVFLNDAKLYHIGNKININAPFEAVKGLFNGKKTLFVHVSGEKEIIDVIDFSKELEVEKLVIVHGREAYKVADLLASNNIPVLIDRSHRLPSDVDEDIHFPYKHAKMLIDKGVTVGISIEGQMERMQSRNLPFYAGTYAAYGLDKEEALKLITSNTAKILGIDTKVGTLEIGKDATLFISEGDALDMRTNILTHAFIKGRNISLETHQTKLWKRYMDKYNSQN
ncbi:amidohydrolase family protein [Urechidicola croceus]|uniref:Amidohydrolase n=1 Tax=Urechidicola croceus TaxID=1850246 RepID=A0A1D8P5A6_9FLAO|nr:amidohydrolase family protein [Urechidicola croceus]AOW19711.1 amidohydrolase [Urechidicola croceus]